MSRSRARVARRAILFCGLAILPLFACSDAGLGTGTSTPGVGGFNPRYTVTYSATALGDGALDALQYLDAEGFQVTVLVPDLPFSIAFEMGGGDAVGLNAVGEVTSGAIQIRVQTARTTGDTPATDERDSCDSDGTPIVCDLSIPTTTL